MMEQDLAISSWNCVHFASTNSVRLLPSGSSIGGTYFAQLDASEAADKTQFLSLIRVALSCPGYVALNWDAIAEAVGDLEWLQNTGFVIVVFNARDLWCRMPKEAGTLVEVALSAAELWSRSQIPFHLVFEMSNEKASVAD